MQENFNFLVFFFRPILSYSTDGALSTAAFVSY